MTNADKFSLQPNPDCPLCNHPQRVAAASMRELHASDEEIATAIGLDPGDVARHFAGCVVVSRLPEDLDSVLDPSASDQQLQVLLQNATELYHSAVLQGNMVAASSALSVRLRCLTEIGRRAEAKSEQAGSWEEADPLDGSTWPRHVAVFVHTYLDDIIARTRAAQEQMEAT